MTNKSFELDVRNILAKYPQLVRIDEREFSGNIELVADNEEILHSFKVRIFLTKEFPYRYPIVWETGGDIPRSVRRHVFPATHNLCLGVVAEEKILCCNGITLDWFIERILIPRLGDEYCVMNGGDYHHEYSHGKKGDWEFYFKELNTVDFRFIKTMLVLLNLNILPKSQDECPCGSGLTYNICHEKSMKRIASAYSASTRVFWKNQLNNLK